MIRSILLHLLVISCLDCFADTPNARHLEEIAYDKGRDRLLLFGGAEIISGKPTEPSNLFEWDGKSWTRIDAVGPVGRRGHGWVYDDERKETILIGGVAEGKTNPDSVLFDMWSWNGSEWKSLDLLCPVKEPRVVYDQKNKRILVLGEITNKHIVKYDGERKFELWQLKSNQWSKLSGELSAFATSRALAYDDYRDRLIVPVFENENLSIWEWSGKEWTQKKCEGSYPAFRTRYALTYSPIDKQTYLFGGLDKDRQQLGDFWIWNGSKWEKIEVDNKPQPRNSAHLEFGTKQLMLYGGSVPKAPPEKGIILSNELWSWSNNSWKLIK